MIATRLNLTHRLAFLQMWTDYAAHDPENGKLYVRGREDYPAYLQRLDDDEAGVSLPPGSVPCSHRWLLDDSGAILGAVRIRHNIGTKFLAEEIGHIGYDVPPSQRGLGHGIACLKSGLEIARNLGLERVLVCADTDNPASWRTIERCGGILEDERMSPYYKKLFRRYWIETGIAISQGCNRCLK
jgi:predicted acetyltransferase